MIEIEKVKISALLDSGSAFNMIHEDVLQTCDPEFEREDRNFVCANGKSSSSDKIKLDFKIGSQHFCAIPFTVVRSHQLQAVLVPKEKINFERDAVEPAICNPKRK